MSRIAETSARSLLVLEHLGSDRRQLIDLLQQRLELGFAQMFAQAPIALLRTGDDRIMRRKAGCGQRDQNLAAVFWVRRFRDQLAGYEFRKRAADLPLVLADGFRKPRHAHRRPPAERGDQAELDR